jgi:uroporphyrinogen-III synthase
MQSVQHQIIKKENAINIHVYQTIKHSLEVDHDTNILVFTSPSNVDAFFEKNKWAPHFKAVAMGEATGKALERKRVMKYEQPDRFDDLGLFRAIMKLSN